MRAIYHLGKLISIIGIENINYKNGIISFIDYNDSKIVVNAKEYATNYGLNFSKRKIENKYLYKIK